MKVDQKHFDVLDKRTTELSKHFLSHESFFDKKVYYDRLDALRSELENYNYDLYYYIGTDNDVKATEICKEFISDCEDMIQRAGVPTNALLLGWSTPDVYLDVLLHFIKWELEKIVEELKK